MLGAIKVYTDMFDIKNIRILAPPAFVILMALAMIAPDYPSIVFEYNGYVRGFCIAMMYLMPIITLIGAFGKKKRRISNANI
jgi:hypothetical protein